MSSSRNNRPNVQRFVPRVEALEDRTVPAGDVHVAVLGGTLVVTGDAAGNQVMIAGTGKSSVMISALDATTTINGRAGPLSVRGISHDIRVRLNGGDDNLLIDSIRTRGTLDVDMGDGNDLLGISDASHRAATILRTGAGDDTIILNGSVLRRYLFIDTGAGDDQVVAKNVGVINVGMVNPAGTDFFDNQNSTFARPAISGFTNGTRPGPTPDTTAPTATISTTTPNPTGTSPIAFTVTFNENVTGFDTSGLTVTNGTATTVTAVDARTFAVQVTPTAQGPVSAMVIANAARDAAGNGNTESNTVSLTFDSIVPVVSSTALTTRNTTPTLTGTVDDSLATVRVTVNNKTYTAAVTSGAWAVNVTDVLPDGTYPVVTTATDAAGNIGTAAPVNLTVDTTAPLVSMFDLDTTFDTGMVGDFRTDFNTVTLAGTTEAGAAVRLYRVTVPGTPGAGTPLMETTAAANGTFNFAGLALAVGPNSFAVRAVDALGNVGATLAQTFTRNTPPTVANPIAPQVLSVSAGDQSFDLTNTFADAERVARLTTAYPSGQTGSIDVQLFATQAPATVTNFLSYNYDGSVFHRYDPNFVLQGGGFGFNDAGTTTATVFPPITKSPPVANEPVVSNTRGTIAMAKSPGDPNSATDEFFFNLADNSTNLNAQNGGFTVFGQVMNGGQQTLNAITGSLTTFSGTGIPGAAPFPIRSGADTTNFPANITANDVALVTTVRELTAVQRMSFAVVGNTDSSVATASVTGGMLTIHPVMSGTTTTTTITVRATDLDGSIVETQIMVTVTP